MSCYKSADVLDQSSDQSQVNALQPECSVAGETIEMFPSFLFTDDSRICISSCNMHSFLFAFIAGQKTPHNVGIPLPEKGRSLPFISEFLSYSLHPFFLPNKRNRVTV